MLSKKKMTQHGSTFFVFTKILRKSLRKQTFTGSFPFLPFSNESFLFLIKLELISGSASFYIKHAR
jgi:hypothetical protein